MRRWLGAGGIVTRAARLALIVMIGCSGLGAVAAVDVLSGSGHSPDVYDAARKQDGPGAAGWSRRATMKRVGHSPEDLAFVGSLLGPVAIARGGSIYLWRKRQLASALVV